MKAWLLALGVVPLISCGAPATAGGGPDAATLVVERAAIQLSNPGLITDDGTQKGPGDNIAGNGVPDGWLLRLKAGAVTFEPTTTPDGDGVRVAYKSGARGSLVGTAVPVKPGESFELRLKVDAGGVEHPGSIGLAFKGPTGLLDTETHRLRTEDTGWSEIAIRATAPVGATQLIVRAVFTGAKSDGSLVLGPLTLERSTASSRSKTFPLKRILLVTIETFRWDHASLHGYSRDTTPTLERLAREGARFDRHYVQAPFTRPSLSSMVTSRYPVSLGITDNVPPLPESAYTAAEIFTDRGYVTSGFLAQFILGQHYGFTQGFHDFFNHKNDTVTETVTRDLYPWLERHKADNTFSWIHLFDPHGPYRPLDGYADRYRDDALYNNDSQMLSAGKGKATGAFVPGYVADPGQLERRHYVANYDAEIRYVDDHLAKLVKWLEDSGQARDTLLVITADHGESMTDHGRYFAHGSLYEHDLHVPMVIWAPGRVTPGTQVTARSSHLDILPTLLDFAGADEPDGLKGHSLRGLMAGGAKAPQPFTIAVTGAGPREQVAVISDSDLKLIVDHKGQPVEVYDLTQDPDETRNLIGSRGDEARKLAGAYRGWVQDQLADDARTTTQDRDLSDDEIEALRALGYIE
jgi:arylsulfatase A-like enzyme